MVEVRTSTHSYSIRIEKGLKSSFGELLEPFNRGQRWVLFTHPGLYEQFGIEILSSLKNSGFDIVCITMPEGESSKTIANVNRIYDQLLRQNCNRSTTFIAFGGGVVGDVTGFVASTFMRGVGYFQVPTTLLSMVDASVGGKTGVNLASGKNLVGTFYQPLGVLIDPDFLRTLPVREIVSGMAEILKCGAVRDEIFFRDTVNNLTQLLALVEHAPLIETIETACTIKAEVVSEDEKESGLRRILNFGHTVGHGIETALSKTGFRHGEAVAYGMLAAGYLSHHYGSLSGEDWHELREAVWQLPLPELGRIDPDVILAHIRHDKKHNHERLNFVLLEKLGKAEISQDITAGQIAEALKNLIS
ncbi:MAG: 3-dehydroquinate synthase [FCB group bacterium]|nr:3-dehydroquinate synthase [FCB group bacterium]